MTLPDPPARSFASDNSSGVHPDVVRALIDAKQGHALAYGADRWTAELGCRYELLGVTKPYARIDI